MTKSLEKILSFVSLAIHLGVLKNCLEKGSKKAVISRFSVRVDASVFQTSQLFSFSGKKENERVETSIISSTPQSRRHGHQPTHLSSDGGHLDRQTRWTDQKRSRQRYQPAPQQVPKHVITSAKSRGPRSQLPDEIENAAPGVL